MYPSFSIFPYLYVTWYAYHLLLPLFQWNVYVSQWPSTITCPGQTCFTSEFTCLPQPSYSGRSLRNVKISQREYIVGFHDDINYNPCHVWEKCVRRDFFFVKLKRIIVFFNFRQRTSISIRRIHKIGYSPPKYKIIIFE